MSIVNRRDLAKEGKKLFGTQVQNEGELPTEELEHENETPSIREQLLTALGEFETVWKKIEAAEDDAERSEDEQRERAVQAEEARVIGEKLVELRGLVDKIGAAPEMQNKQHNFKKDKEAGGVEVCEECGFVKGEIPKQPCPMDPNKRG